MSKRSVVLTAVILTAGGLSLWRISMKGTAYAAQDPQIAHAEKLIHEGRSW